MDYYKPRLVCVARCKNEIHILKKWMESLPFVDLFCMTDNNSTDGSYEYLKSRDNVLVTRVEDYHEGRDFQILLKMARAHEPEWLLKIDCDEIFEDLAIKNFHKLLEQEKFDAIFFRRFTFDYRLKNDEYKVSKGNSVESPLLCLARNTGEIDILNIKSHVGPFMFYKKPALSSLRLRHYSLPSYKKAKEKYDTYMGMKGKDDKRSYDRLVNINEDYIATIPKRKFEEPEKTYLMNLDMYGMSCLKTTDKIMDVITPKKNNRYLKIAGKKIMLVLISFFRLNSLVKFYLEKRLKR